MKPKKRCKCFCGAAKDWMWEVLKCPIRCAHCVYDWTCVPWGKLCCMGYWGWLFGFAGYGLWMLGEKEMDSGRELSAANPDGDQVFPFYQGFERGGDNGPSPLGDGIGAV